MWHPAQSPHPAPTRDTPAVQSSTFAAGAPSTRQRRTDSGYWRSLFRKPLHPSSASQRRGCGALGDSGHKPEAGIKGTPRRGKGFRRYPLRQDGRWPGVGRRKEEEEGGSSHLPAAVPAGWEVAVGHQGLGSVRSKQPAVCNTQPRRHCNQAGSQGVLQDPHQWPLVLWAQRIMSGWQKNLPLIQQPHPIPTQQLTLLLVVLFPGLGVVLLWGCPRLLRLLA